LSIAEYDIRRFFYVDPRSLRAARTGLRG